VPKQKTRKAVSGRMKLTKNGKVIRRHMMTGCRMTCKSAKRRRKLRQSAVAVGRIAKNLRKMMGA